MTTSLESVWVFCGQDSRFPAAVFVEHSEAVDWIAKTRASGTLNKYPLGQSVYDWAIAEGFFEPTKDKHRTPKFIQGFTSASMGHFHFEEGEMK